MAKQLTEIEAAIRVRISPDLLRWFTRYAPKHGCSRKLPFTERDGEYFYNEEELIDFNDYLKKPWPRPAGAKRPHVPEGIRQEIKIEANHKCAFCEYTNSGEGAHIDAVHKGGCNHPHNLIWSCPNHHSEYDLGHKIGTLVKEDHVRVIKELLLESRLRHWRMELRTVAGCLSVIEELRKISKYIVSPQFAEVRSELAGLAKRTVEAAAEAAKIDLAKHVQSSTPSYVRYAAKIAALVPGDSSSSSHVIEEAAQTINAATEEYLEESGLATCPLCKGAGEHNQYQCPICAGEGAIHEDDLDEIDLLPYKQVNCPLCKGTGDHNRFDCPICFSIGTVDIATEDEIDLRPFLQVKCPLCKGSGDHNRFDCPVCTGVGTVDVAREEEIDLSPYQQRRCPVCRGHGDRDGFDCPLCIGVGTIDAEREETLDLAQYKQVNCPVCKGKGCRQGGQDCAACNATGKMDETFLETLDLSLYEQVKCPACRGCGEHRRAECQFCRGSGRVDFGVAENFEPSDWE